MKKRSVNPSRPSDYVAKLRLPNDGNWRTVSLAARPGAQLYVFLFAVIAFCVVFFSLNELATAYLN